MVISGEAKEEEIPTKSPTKLPERSKPLHNFSFPSLKWGSQKVLRCFKVDEGTSADNATKELVDGGGKGVKEKLLTDLGTGPTVTEKEEDASKPCNLRRRRAACKVIGFARDKKRNSVSPQPNISQRLKNKERGKFSTLLTREEIELDFLVLTGAKPSRRPRKRPRVVQKELDTLLPALWLTEVTAERYMIN